MCKSWSLLEEIFTSVVLRAREHVQTPNWSPPEYVVLFSAVFASQSVKVRSLKLEGDAFRRMELANLTEI